MEKKYTLKETSGSKKQVAVAVVQSAAAGLGALLKSYRNEEERTGLIRKYVHAVRFFTDRSGYYFVYKTSGLNIALPNPAEWEGKDLKNYQDSKGTYVIREAASAAKKGGGFIQYYWTNPLTQADQKKIAYVEMIPGTSYLIGTGFYE